MGIAYHHDYDILSPPHIHKPADELPCIVGTKTPANKVQVSKRYLQTVEIVRQKIRVISSDMSLPFISQFNRRSQIWAGKTPYAHIVSHQTQCYYCNRSAPPLVLPPLGGGIGRGGAAAPNASETLVLPGIGDCPNIVNAYLFLSCTFYCTGTAGHILSGACIPSSRKPFLRAQDVAHTSNNRARRRLSVSARSTGHCSKNMPNSRAVV
jgi:hypothetical protein